MARTSFTQWYAAAREAYLELCSLRPEVYIAGLSMGGIFTVLLAAEFRVKKIALLATPRTLKEKIIYITPVLGLFKRIWWQADPGKGLLSEKARAEHVCYDQGIPVRQSWQLFRAIGKAMRSLPQVTADALLVQSSLDPVIPADSLDHIHGRIGSKKKKSVMLRRSGHAITVDFEKARVAGLVIRFFGDSQS
jgi:carboxylesterase